MANSEQFCTFFLDGHFFGIPVQRVQEVIRYQEMTPVPLVPDVVRGLINLRGQIVTAVDLRACLGLPERGADELPMNVVIRTDDGAVSFLVDEIGDVIAVTDEAHEKPPENLQGISRSMIHGVYKLSGRLLLELDIARVLSVADTSEPAREIANAAL